MKINTISALAIGLGVYLLLQNQKPRLNPNFQNIPAPPPRNSPNFMQWAQTIVQLYGPIASLWQPGGPFYKEPVPQYDAGALFWQNPGGTIA